MPAMVSRMKAIMAVNDNTFDHVVSKSFMCAGGIQGYDIDSAAVVEVLLATLTCAFEEGGKCIAPPGNSKSIHRYDQAAFSVAIAYSGRACETDRRFWAYKFLHHIPESEFDQNAVVLHLRRWAGPYAKWAARGLDASEGSRSRETVVDVPLQFRAISAIHCHTMDVQLEDDGRAEVLVNESRCNGDSTAHLSFSGGRWGVLGSREKIYGAYIDFENRKLCS